MSHGLKSLYDYNSPESPILLLLSGGVDPTSDVESLAAEMEVELIQIALENKNDTVADKIRSAMETGSWIMLKGSCRRSCVVPKIKFRNRN